MKIDILAGGSSGNCIAVRSSETTILIDAGIAKTKIEKRLLEVGIRPDSIEAIFVTHAHSDHIKGLPLANKYHIPVFAAKDEWKSIQGIETGLTHYIDANETIPWKDIKVTSFKVHHDAYDPRGYTVRIGDKKVAVCLDTGHVDKDIIHAMEGSDIYVIEANHEPAMLEFSNYPNSVKARILSDIGHLSNEQTADTLAQLVQGKGEKIYLTHLSSSNNLPELAKMSVMRKLASKGLKLNYHYEIEVI